MKEYGGIGPGSGLANDNEAAVSTTYGFWAKRGRFRSKYGRLCHSAAVWSRDDGHMIGPARNRPTRAYGGPYDIV